MNDYQCTNEKGDYIDYWELVNDNGELCREIEKLQQENKKLREKYKATNKGLIKVLSKRLKWKRRYYKEKYLTDKLTKQLTDEYKNTEVQCELKNKYKDILEELKKWLEECLKEKNKIRLEDNNSYEAGVIDTYENVLDKIKELEEGVK